MIEAISVHVPKTAGHALYLALCDAYGRPAVFGDYEDRPVDPNAPMNRDWAAFMAGHAAAPRLDPRVRVVHGHFHIGKYRALSGPLRFTFLRDPVERLISNYRFWRRTPPHGHSLHDQVIKDDLDLLAFARLPTVRHTYTGVFFRDVDMSVFDFIGAYERLEADTARLSEMLGRPLQLPITNETPTEGHTASRHDRDPGFEQELRQLLSKDIAFYAHHTLFE